MNLLLDAGVIIALAGDPGRAATLWDGVEGRCAVSVVSVDELLRSGARSEDASVRAKRTAVIGVVAERFEILPVDESVIQVHATLRSGIRNGKMRLGSHEGWIAATCLAHGFTLLTDRVNTFRSVGHLTIRAWKSGKID